MISRVFLSHADTDVDLARLLQEELRRAKPAMEVFVSSVPGAIPTGEEWLSEIKRQLKASDAYLILLTPASVQRLWVWYESGAAFMSDKRLIGVCAPGMQKNAVPSPLSGHQLLSLHSPDECEQVFKEFGVTVQDVAAFMEAALTAADKGTSLLALAAGWTGIQHGARYFAWDGPLDEMEDREALICPAGLTDAVRALGLIPTFGNVDKLQSLADGQLQVFLTDRRVWKRPVVNSGKQLLLVRGSPDVRPSAFDKAREVREREAGRERKTRMLHAETGVNAASREFAKLSADIERMVKQIGTPLSVELFENAVAIQYARQFRVTVEWIAKYINTLNESRLVVAEWKGGPPGPHQRIPPLRQTEFQFDVAPSGDYVWRRDGAESELFGNLKLADWCVTTLLGRV